MPRLLLALYLVGLGAIVMWPGGIRGVDLSQQLNALGLGWVTYNDLESFANVVLFVPLGLLVAAMVPTRRWWIVLIGIVALSVSIELAQSSFLIGRVSSINDVFANVLGGVIGVGIAGIIRGVGAAVRRRRRPRPDATLSSKA